MPAAPGRPAYRPSPALARWRTIGRAELTELVAAHHAVGGRGPGRRTATQQINHALVVQLAAQFQRYCRDLHDLCITAVAATAPVPLRSTVREAFTRGRRLDRQNAHSAALGDDFGRFVADFWPAVDRLGHRFAARRRRLDQLNVWRNAIAHHDFRHISADALTRGTRVDLATFHTWYRALDELAGGIDRTVHAGLLTLTGVSPW
jgi:hypothetical protein